MGNVHDKPDRKDAPLASVMQSVPYVRLVLRSVQVLLPKRSNYRLGCAGYNGFSSFQWVVGLLKGPWVLCSKRRSYWVKAAIYLKMDNFSNYTCFLWKLKTAELANARTVNDVILGDNRATLSEVCKPNKNVIIFICILASHLASNSCTISTSDRFLNSRIGARVSFDLPLKFSYIYLWSDWQHCSIFDFGTVGNGNCWCWLVTSNAWSRPDFQWLAVIEWCD